MRPLFARWRLAAAGLSAVTLAAAGLTLSGQAQPALAATVTQTGPFPVGNLLNYVNSDIESSGFNWAADESQASNVSSIGQDNSTSLMHANSLKIVAAGTGPMIYKLGNSQDGTSTSITLPKTGGDYRVGAYMKVPAGASQHTVEFDLACYDSGGSSLGWVTGSPVTMNSTGSWQYVEDDFLAGTPSALPSACAQVQGSPRVQVTGMHLNGVVHQDEAIFAPYRAAIAIGAHGLKQCDGPQCPYTASDWWAANQAIAPLPNKALQTDKEFSANGALPSSFGDTNCQGDEDQLTSNGLNETKWPVCIITYQTPVTANPTDPSTSQAMDDFLASVPKQQEIILVWAQEPEGKSFLPTDNPPVTLPGCTSATSEAAAFKCETELQATFVHNARGDTPNSPGDTPNVLIAQDSAGSKYANGQVGAGCQWITPSSATGAGVDLYLVDHYEYQTVTGQNVNQIPTADEWQNWLKCASAQNRPLGFGEYGLDNSPDPSGPQQGQQYPKGCQATSQDRTNLPGALDADSNYLSQLPMSGDPNLVNPAPFAVWDYWDSFWGGTPDCTVLDDQAAMDKWRSIETQNGGGG